MKTKWIILWVVAGLFFLPAMMGMSRVWGDNCADNPEQNTDDKTLNKRLYDQLRVDPISMATGAFTNSVTDLTVKGITPLVMTRYYNSTINYNGTMGLDWDFTFNRYLDFEENCVYYDTGKGSKVPMYYGGGSGIMAVGTKPTYLVLTASSDGSQFFVTDKHGNQDTFDSQGYLIASKDRNGNQLTYTRDGNELLLKVEDAYGHYMTFSYTSESEGRVTAVTDSSGRTVNYTYSDDGSFNLTEVDYPGTTDFPCGTSIKYHYDDGYEVGYLTQEIDGAGNSVVQNTYAMGGGDESPLGTVEVQTQDGTHDSTYDMAMGGVVTTDPATGVETSGTGPIGATFTDYDGNVTDYSFDYDSNITTQTVHTSGYHSGEPSTYVTNYTYDTNDNRTQESDPNGNTMTWTYDGYNNVLTVAKAFPSGCSVHSTEGSQVTSATTTYTYESRFNQVASIVDPIGNTTTYCYGTAESNPGGNVLKIKYPTTAAGTAEETFTYNSAGQVLTDTAPDGTVTKNVYDGSTGYLSETIKDYGTGKLNATTHYTYDAVGNVTSVTDPNGNTTTNTYNALDELVETDGPNGEVETRTYDQNKNLVDDIKSAPDSHTEKTENVYDTQEQLVATKVYTNATDYLETDYTYDYAGNRLTVTDPLGHEVQTAYDERSKPYLTTDAEGHTTKLDYDGNGNTVKLTDELSNVTTYAYDGLDKLEKKTFPDSTYQKWIYDANGNITGLRTTAGNSITQTYDTRNRMLTQVYPVTGGTSTITNVYDIMGRVSSTSEGGTSLSYTYDNLGRNLTFTDQAGRESTYTYDLDGHRLTSTYPTSVEVKRYYDSSNRLHYLRDGSNSTQATYSYDILDRVTGVSLANSTSVAYSYDLLNRLGSVDNTLDSGNRNYSYVYDNASRVTSVTEPRGTITSDYTKRNEVKGITEPDGSPFSDQSFCYDAGYNRSSWKLGATTTDYTANNLDQYTAVGSATPTWNSDGGLATFAGNTYTYDALMRLTEVDTSLGKFLFSYDPLGRRVKKVDENTEGTVLGTTTYHYDGSEVAVEYQPSTTWTYYLGLGIDQVVMRTDGTNKQWYYRDGHGSVSAVADNSGDLLEAYEYDAQGHFQITDGSDTDITATGTAIGNELMYTGREYDAETGNYFYRARYYNPDLGRFISRDPLSGAEFSQGTNLYAYCRNNFLNASDPTGMSCKVFGYDLNQDLQTAANATNPNYSPDDTLESVEGTWHGTGGADWILAAPVGVAEGLIDFAAAGADSLFSSSAAGAGGGTVSTGALWTGTDGYAAANAAGYTTMAPSAAANAAAASGDYSLMNAESAAFAGSQTGMVQGFIGSGTGATFYNYELPAVMQSIDAGTADGLELHF